MTSPEPSTSDERGPTFTEEGLVIEMADQVADALGTGGPVVALESTIFSELGLPFPANAETLSRCLAAVEASQAVPAVTAILDGVPTLGVNEPAILCGPTRKTARRDLGVAVAQRWPYGATTVSASLTLAAAAGIEVFATGGIGGVHRGWGSSGDISADLTSLAEFPVVTVSAGAKVFLDLGATLEHLETHSVPVLGWRTSDFPAFHAASSGLAVPHRVDEAEEVAEIARVHWALGGGGILLVAPVPDEAGLAFDEIEAAVEVALSQSDVTATAGGAVTPAVLAALAEATEGASLPANIALAENNARIAADVAVALAQQ